MSHLCSKEGVFVKYPPKTQDWIRHEYINVFPQLKSSLTSVLKIVAQSVRRSAVSQWQSQRFLPNQKVWATLSEVFVWWSTGQEHLSQIRIKIDSSGHFLLQLSLIPSSMISFFLELNLTSFRVFGGIYS